MKIVFGSDLIMRDYPEYIGDDAVEYMFGDMKSVFDDADFRMMNLEAIFNRDFEPIIKSGPAHFALPEFVQVLHFLHIDLVGAANNHTGDYGEDGVLYTMEILRENRIPFVGMGKNIEEAYNAHVFEKDGETVNGNGMAVAVQGTRKGSKIGASHLDVGGKIVHAVGIHAVQLATVTDGLCLLGDIGQSVPLHDRLFQGINIVLIGRHSGKADTKAKPRQQQKRKDDKNNFFHVFSLSSFGFVLTQARYAFAAIEHTL